MKKVTDMLSVSAGLDIFCILILTLILVSLLTQKRKNNRESVIMFMLIPDAMLYIATGLVMIYCTEIPALNTLCVIANSISYSAGYVLAALILNFLVINTGNPNLIRHTSTISSIASMPFGVFVVTSQFHGLVFKFVNGTLIRGPLYLLGYGYIVLIYLFLIYLSITQKELSLTERCIELLIPVIHTLSIIAQTLYPNLKLTYPASALVILLIYMMNYNHIGQNLFETKEELTKAQISMMLSKIQPHFLFNALSSISALCKENPDLAKKAIDDFSKYLRHNMDSIGNDKIIDFKQELQHTETFLTLEKLRFEQRLNINYSIQVDDFKIPSLTLQPIVENAIKHGVNKKEQGGTVSISTEKNDKFYIITVMDDGIGFNAEHISFDDSRSHIGLKNVHDRLEKMCSGYLEISSQVNKGTTVKIFIPV